MENHQIDDDENIKVFIRVRPFNQKELKMNE